MTWSRTTSTALYLAVAAPVCLLLLGSTDLIRMEPIIALGARHMIDGGSWIIPRLYGEVYAFKPPLAYWLCAAAGSTIGWSEWALRLPSAVCGLALGLLICLVIGRLASPRCGLVAGLAAVTSGLFIEQVRMVGFDMPVALGVGLAVLAAIRNLTSPRSSLSWWVLGYTGLLFAFVAKGLPGVALYTAGLLAAAIAIRKTRLLWRWQHIAGASLFLIGAAVYLLQVYREGGSAVFAQHVGEVLERGTGWTPRAVLMTLLRQVAILAAFLPGSALLMLGLVRRSPRDADSPLRNLRIASWGFLLAGGAVLMMSPASNARYYLPLATPLAILAGLYAESFNARQSAPAAGARRRWRAVVAADPTAWMVLAGCIYWVVFVGVVEPKRATRLSLRAVASQFKHDVSPDETVYVDTGDSYSSLFWYLGRPVRVWSIDRPLPPAPAGIVLVNDQIETVKRIGGDRLVMVAQESARDGRRYALFRVGVSP